MPLKRLPEDLTQLSGEALDSVNWDEYEPTELDRMIEHQEKQTQSIAAEEAQFIQREVAQEAQQAQQAKQLHKQNVSKMRRTGLGILAGTALAGGALYGGKKLYDHMNKQSNDTQLSEQDMATLRLLSMSPEERALHQRVNPSGLLAMHAPSEEPKLAGVGDFLRKNVMKRSPDYIKKRNEIATAGKHFKEQKLLEQTAKRKGLVDDIPEKAPEAPKKSFLSRNKVPLAGAGLLAGGGAYAYNDAQQQAKFAANPTVPKWPLIAAGALGAAGLAYGGKTLYDNYTDKQAGYVSIFKSLGLSKLAAKLPPPIPFKAKSQTAKQGKPFFTPSQANTAKKMDGPAPSKAPWEEKTSAFNQGYLATLSQLKLAGAMATMLKKSPIHRGAARSAYAEGFGVRAAKPVQGPNTVDKVKGVAGNAVDKAKGAWNKMPTWGKGMAAGGAGMGLLGAGAAMGSSGQQQPEGRLL
jgi:hypothetical protein